MQDTQWTHSSDRPGRESDRFYGRADSVAWLAERLAESDHLLAQDRNVTSDHYAHSRMHKSQPNWLQVLAYLALPILLIGLALVSPLVHPPLLSPPLTDAFTRRVLLHNDVQTAAKEAASEPMSKRRAKTSRAAPLSGPIHTARHWPGRICGIAARAGTRGAGRVLAGAGSNGAGASRGVHVSLPHRARTECGCGARPTERGDVQRRVGSGAQADARAGDRAGAGGAAWLILRWRQVYC